MTGYICDTNIWLALAVEPHDHAEAAREWLRSVREPHTLAFCRMTQQSYLRLITSLAVLARYKLPPLTNAQAWATYDAFLQDGRISFVSEEPSGIEQQWREYAERPTASPKLWMDAYLAAFAKAADYQLVTTDRGFRQFRGLDLLVLGAGAKT